MTKLPPKVAVITFDAGKNQDYEMNIFKGTKITIKTSKVVYFRGTIESLLWKLNDKANNS